MRYHIWILPFGNITIQTFNIYYSFFFQNPLVVVMSAVKPDNGKATERTKVSGSRSAAGVPQDNQTQIMVRDRLAKGFVMFVLAILVLIAGFVGYTGQ